MKRDWMQTGRKPSGLCSAELYIAALSHGYDYTKADIAAVVHVCEATLSKRLIEFENTDLGSLTNIIGDKHNSAITSGEVVGDSVDSKDPGGEGKNGSAVGDSESLSDIDDLEVDGYLHNEQETQFKKVIWEEMNKEYLEEQAAKEALAAELASRGVVMEEGKRKRRKHNEDAENSTPAQTPAEATQNMLKRKRLGSKINDEAVNKLYNTNDEDNKADEEMAFNDDHGQHTGDGETFEGGTDYPDYNYMMAMVMESTTIMMLIFNTS